MSRQETVELLVNELHADGYGTANFEGKRFGVVDGLPGEQVVARPFRRLKRRTFCRTISVTNPSIDRVEPACSAAGICGGCSLQHLSHAAQLRVKQNRFDALFAQFPPYQSAPAITGSLYGYRTKGRLGVRFVEKKNKVLVGFREKYKPYVAEIENCSVLAAPLGEMLEGLGELVAKLDGYDKIPQIEVAVGEVLVPGMTQVALSFRHLEVLSEKDHATLCEFGESVGVDIYLQPAGLDTVWRLWSSSTGRLPPDGHGGEDNRLFYALPEHQISMAFHPYDFTQVNMQVNRLMVNQALDWLCPGDHDLVADLFSGIGNFSLPLARKSADVLALEFAQQSVDRGRENARRNDIGNVRFDVADLYNEPLDPGWLSDRTKALIDPPRSGAAAVCRALGESPVRKIVYVSCNPVTLADDLGLLINSGFQLDQAGIVDMFPHTNHVESMACLSRT